MKKTAEYRARARQCRVLADQMTVADHRDQLSEMAEAWDRLADEREEGLRIPWEPQSFELGQ